MRHITYAMVAALAMMLLPVQHTQAQNKALKVVSLTVAQGDNTSTDSNTSITYDDEVDGQTKYCPVIKVRMPNEQLVFKGKMMEAQNKTGEYWVYMYQDAKNLKVFDSSRQATPVTVNFKDYGITSLNGQSTYVLTLGTEDVKNDIHNVYSSVTLGLGASLVGLPGPYLALGYNYKNFGIELMGTYGVATSDDFILKETSEDATSEEAGSGDGSGLGCNFRSLQLALRLGYDFRLARTLAVTPQVGVVYTYLTDYESGGSIDESVQADHIIKGPNLFKNDDEDVGSSAWSASLGLRFMFAPFGPKFRIQVTPEYRLKLSNDDLIGRLGAIDKTIKKGYEGFNLTAGLLLYF